MIDQGGCEGTWPLLLGQNLQNILIQTKLRYCDIRGSKIHKNNLNSCFMIYVLSYMFEEEQTTP